jgi:hypothetical protein
MEELRLELPEFIPHRFFEANIDCSGDEYSFDKQSSLIEFRKSTDVNSCIKQLKKVLKHDRKIISKSLFQGTCYYVIVVYKYKECGYSEMIDIYDVIYKYQYDSDDSDDDSIEETSHIDFSKKYKFVEGQGLMPF